MYTIRIKQGDITQSDCACIVNAANNSLLGGGGVDGAIHYAAGPQLLDECKTLNGCKTGEAKITKGYLLKAKWVIHTVGPIYSGEDKDEILLASCYRNSLNLAKEHDIHSISFPAISTGDYGYTARETVRIALNTVIEWLRTNCAYDMTVEFCCFDETMYSCYCGIYDTMTKNRDQQYKEFAQFCESHRVRVKDAIEMHLADAPFDKMKSGEKTIEIRLYDEKRKKIKIGDAIVFYRENNHDEWITASVIGLRRFQSFKELFYSDLYPKTGCGNMTPDEATRSMYHYYTSEQEDEYGVLAIEVKCN